MQLIYNENSLYATLFEQNKVSQSFALEQCDSAPRMFTITVIYDAALSMVIVFVGKMLKLRYKLEQMHVPLLGMICGNGKAVY